MILESTAIMQALAPGVALTSSIFYYGNLQARMVFTVETIRSLNCEARDIQANDPAAGEARLTSIRWQVDFLARRFQNIHHAMLSVYCGFGSFIATIVVLLLVGIFPDIPLSTLALFTFTIGLGCIGAATVISSQELRLARQTILEDIDSSHQWAPPPRPQAVLYRFSRK